MYRSTLVISGGAPSLHLSLPARRQSLTLMLQLVRSVAQWLDNLNPLTLGSGYGLTLECSWDWCKKQIQAGRDLIPRPIYESGLVLTICQTASQDSISQETSCVATDRPSLLARYPSSSIVVLFLPRFVIHCKGLGLLLALPITSTLKPNASSFVWSSMFRPSKTYRGFLIP